MCIFRHRISVCSWNINGINHKIFGDKSKYNDFRTLIQNHDITILTETWSNFTPQINGFNYFSVNPSKRSVKKTGRSSGGITILYRNSLKSKIEVVKHSSNFVWCKIPKTLLGRHKDLFLCGLYIPPVSSSYFDNNLFDILERDIDKFSKQGNVMFLGDFNARTGLASDAVSKEGNNLITNDCSALSFESAKNRNNFDKEINSHGKRLLELCQTFELNILNGRTFGDSLGKPTYHGKNGTSVVDYAIVDQHIFQNINYFVVNQPSFLSDHSSICVWINTSLTTSRQPGENKNSNYSSSTLRSLPPQFIWSNDSCELFKMALSSPEVTSLLDSFMNNNYAYDSESVTVNTAAKDLQEILLKAASMSLKVKRIKNTGRKVKSCNKKWFDFECMKARKSLRQLSNLKHRDPTNPILRKSYHEKLNEFKKLLKTKKLNFQREKLEELEKCKENVNFWKLLKSANDEYSETKVPPVSEKQWLDHFNNLHAKPKNSSEHDLIEHKLADLEKSNAGFDNELDHPITEKEIKALSKKLKNKKAAFVDKINNEMIKSSISLLCPTYLKLFNLILQTGIYPDSWCEGSITPIFKSGDLSDPNNYRGICVSSCLGKFFSSILNHRLLLYADKNKLLHNAQIGFLPHHRTADHIFTLRTIVDKYVHNRSGGKVFACFIDLKKAFDSIWHNGLLYKLQQNNINGHFYDLIKNIYSKSNCFIKLGSEKTKNFQYSRGVRQGCILSPLLFNLYLNDLPISLSRATCTDPFLLPNGEKLSSLLYADDLVLISKSREGLQNCINVVSSFCDSWHLTVNHKKSKILIFKKKSSKSTREINFFLKNQNLEIVEEFTYLGVKISSTGNFQSHRALTKQKALHALFKVIKTLEFNKLKPKQANILFDTLISPILTYGSEVWGVYLKQNFSSWDKELTEKVHLRFCKYYLGVNSKASNFACRAELGRFPLKVAIDKFVLRYYNHLVILPDSALAKQAFLISKSLHEKKKKCYHSNLHDILKFYNITNDLTEQLSNSQLNKYECSMKVEYINFCTNSIMHSKKLEFYQKLKVNYDPEPYLDIISNFSQRRNLTKLRISNHNLAIESGRYNNVERDNRFCLLCPSNVIETEEHMILNCSLYNDLRFRFEKKVKHCTNDSLTSETIYDLLSTNNNDMIMYLAIFISKCFKLRENMLQELCKQ